jgi:hypothetical protein
MKVSRYTVSSAFHALHFLESLRLVLGQVQQEGSQLFCVVLARLVPV